MSAARIIEGDCLAALPTLAAGSVQTCITSPPYYGLRDYGTDGQIGLEETPEQYVANLVAVFREVRRVLRDDGTLWLNLGDSYAVNGGARQYGSTDGATGRADAPGDPRRAPLGYKPKDLLGIPWMVAFAFRADGWYLRSDIIWSKPNPMPESVTDRPTKAHEYLFLLSKSARYFWDADAVREPHESDGRGGFSNKETLKTIRHEQAHAPSLVNAEVNPAGRNKRSVWTVATQPFPGAHFATFPPKLIEPCVLAGSSPQACAECGAPWERVVERTPMVVEASERRVTMENEQDEKARTQTGGTMTQAPSSRTLGWQPSCDHSDGSARCTVLDPFSGAGTTGVVALRHDREYIGIELNADYAQMARYRIADDAPLLNEVA